MTDIPVEIDDDLLDVEDSPPLYEIEIVHGAAVTAAGDTNPAVVHGGTVHTVRNGQIRLDIDGQPRPRQVEAPAVAVEPDGAGYVKLVTGFPVELLDRIAKLETVWVRQQADRVILRTLGLSSQTVETILNLAGRHL